MLICINLLKKLIKNVFINYKYSKYVVYIGIYNSITGDCMQLKTIEKALMVLKCFMAGERSFGTTELADRLGTSKATMSRVLTTLKKHDFLEQDPSTRQYRFGRAMVELARVVYRSLDGRVTAVATPIAKSLRDAVGETVHLEVQSGSNIYLAYVAMTPNPISLKIKVGDHVMPNAHAGSKAIIAFSPSEVIEKWVTQKFYHYTRNTITDPDRLRALYAEIRQGGVAYDYGEYIDDVNAVGAPIFNHENNPVAGLLIVAPSYRMKKWNKRYITRLKLAANAISAGLHSSRKV